MEDKKIKISIKVEAIDMFWFMMQHTYLSISGVISLLFSAGALFMLYKTWNEVQIQYTVVLALCALLFTVINPAMIYKRASKQVAANKGLQKAVEYTFTESGFMMEQGEEKGEAAWEDLWKVKDGKRYLYLYGNRIRANILPKNQMDGKAEQITKLIRESGKKGEMGSEADGTMNFISAKEDRREQE